MASGVASKSPDDMMPLTLGLAPGMTSRCPQWMHLPCLPASSSGTCSVALQPGHSICMGFKHQDGQANATKGRERPQTQKCRTSRSVATSYSVYTEPQFGETGRLLRDYC